MYRERSFSMKATVVFSTGLVIALSLLLSNTGCVSKEQWETCKRQNAIVNERLESLLANQESGRLLSEQWKLKYENIIALRSADQQKIQALLDALKDKQARIEQLANQAGQVALPIELSNALQQWAASSGSDLVTYDARRGIVRFKSDLLFEKGQDAVQPQAQAALEALSKILVTSAALNFDILTVGHTDDVPVLKPATRAKHPTNWHLSVHRAIAVEKIMAQAGCNEKRMVVMGMGEFRPIEPNKPGKKGNPKNRRVEIYIVPAGQISINSQNNSETK